MTSELVTILNEKRHEYAELYEQYRSLSTDVLNNEEKIHNFVANYIVASKVLGAYLWNVTYHTNNRFVFQCNDHISELDVFVTENDIYSRYTNLYFDDYNNVYLNYYYDAKYTTITINTDKECGMPYVYDWLKKFGISVDLSINANPEFLKTIKKLRDRISVLENVLCIVNGTSDLHGGDR